MRFVFRTFLILFFSISVLPLAAQQELDYGMPVPPLPEQVVEYQTAEDQDIRLVVVARGLYHPWGLTFLPDGGLLVTEHDGKLRLIRNDILDPDPIAGVPEVLAGGFSGLLDIALHPQFSDNRFVYLSYVKPLADEQSALAVARGQWDGKALTGTHDIFVADTDTSAIARIVFGADGMLYMSTYGGDAQDPGSHGGKILRLRDDGSVPPDNPFTDVPGHKPEIYTLGHRSTLGLVLHEESGQIWQNENGPNGGDEINILRPGANYGWPLVSLGRMYHGPWQSENFSLKGFESPTVYWTPSIAVSGMTFYQGDKFPKWKGNAFVGSMRTGEIPGTGHVERIVFNRNMEEIRRESLLVDLRQRIRDVREGPDGFLYLLTDEDDGAVLRIESAHRKE